MSGLREGDSPLDMPTNGHGDAQGLTWAFGIVFGASVMLAVFNAGGIQDWSGQLRVGPATVPAIKAASYWHQMMASLGLTGPMAAAKQGWQEFRKNSLDCDVIQMRCNSKLLRE